jgi:glycosyltransferase involved in cell wall biosynthesis
MMSSHELWSETLPERLAKLKPGTIRVAYLAPRPEYGTFRYRCFNPVDAINGSSAKLSASYFFYSDQEILADLSDYADVLVVSRCPWDAPLDRLFRRFRNKGKKIYFDIDDLIFDTKFASTVSSALGNAVQDVEFNRWTAFISNIGRALAASDEVITTNSYLAQRITDFAALPVHIVPNSYNRHQELRSQEALEAKREASPGLHIGYFSGSQSHSKDFAVVSHHLEQFLDESQKSRLTVVGHLQLPAAFERFGKRVIRTPFVDFLDMQSLVSGVDLNIVPLQDNPFTWSKSELKYFEAALVETPTLASVTPVFSEAIQPGKTGFLAHSTEWLERFREIDALGPEGRSGVGAAGRDHVRAVYSPEHLLLRVESIFGKQN